MFSLLPSRAIAFTVAGFSVHWYGIMYLLAFLAAYFLLPRLQKYRQLTLSRDDWSTLVSWAVIGVIVGGRLGYVLFYEPAYFLQNPLQIFAVWNGGMSSHGGFIGVTLALLIHCRARHYPILKLADVIVVPTALGLAFGRLGNFINLELYGIPTTLPWGILIPGLPEPRHPTQIYAMIKDLTIMACCYWHLRKVVFPPFGRTLALFLTMYGVLRFIVEHFRDQPYSGIVIDGIALTRGQILTVPIILIGIGLYIFLRARGQKKTF